MRSLLRCTADSVRSSSLAIPAALSSVVRCNATTSALYSAVNVLRFLRRVIVQQPFRKTSPILDIRRFGASPPAPRRLLSRNPSDRLSPALRDY